MGNREQFPDLHGVALSDGHVDRICGTPRCIAQMDDGPRAGLYVALQTDRLIMAGERLVVDGVTGRARASHSKEGTRDNG